VQPFIELEKFYVRDNAWYGNVAYGATNDVGDGSIGRIAVLVYLF
jgi:hypothetical protein